jgi:hypothetical protein
MENKNELSEEREQDLPVLGALKKTMPQLVPAGYFNALPEIILSKVLAQTTIEEVKTKKVFFMRSWMRYAAAAVFIGVVFIAGYFYTVNQSKPSFNYQQYSNSDIAKILPTVSDNDLQVYLNISTSIAGVENTIQSNEALEPGDIVLDQLSDEDLLQYLSEQNKPIVKKSS